MEGKNMKRFFMGILIISILVVVSFSGNQIILAVDPSVKGIAEKKVDVKLTEKAEKIKGQLSDKEQIEALKDDDPRRQQVMTLTWQIQYYREQLRNMEMKKLIECYQSKEYRDTLAKIENLNKQIRAILLLGG